MVAIKKINIVANITDIINRDNIKNKTSSFLLKEINNDSKNYLKFIKKIK